MQGCRWRCRRRPRGQIAALSRSREAWQFAPHLASRPYKDWRLETRQLLNVTIRSREIWSPTQQCGGVSEAAADVDVCENYLANHFGQHPAPLGDFLLLPTRADRTFGWPSSTNELF